MDKLDMAIVEGVATLLAQKAATHPRFFEALAMTLTERGYSLRADQRGVQGTHIYVTLNPKR